MSSVRAILRTMGRCLSAAMLIAPLAALVGACQTPPSSGHAGHPRRPGPPQLSTPSGEVASCPAPSEAISAMDFGARGDGTTDDREALQAAIRASARQHRALYLPPGTYEISGAPRQEILLLRRHE